MKVGRREEGACGVWGCTSGAGRATWEERACLVSGGENVNESPEVGVAACVWVESGKHLEGRVCGSLSWVCGSVSFFHSCNATLWCLSALAFQWVMNEGDSWLQSCSYIIY